jgi:hypothetical protein
MSIKKFIASKDTTITDAFQENLVVRGIYSNMGAADSLEMFSIYGQESSSSLERSRVLVQFPITDILQSRTNGQIPASGSVQFFLKLSNVEHPFSLPRDYTANIAVISGSWEEGYGKDMEGYTDLGYNPTGNGYGCSWIYSGVDKFWQNEGGDSLTGSEYNRSFYFNTGLEDLDVDVTDITEKWISGQLDNSGFLVSLSGAFEDGNHTSYYTKRFSSRGSEFFYKKPCIEARWNPAVIDDRNNFYASSSFVSADDNKMNLYFYNKVRGTLKNIVNDPIPEIKFFLDENLTQEISSSYSFVTNPFPGVYKASVAIDTTASVLYDKWVSPATGPKYFKSSFDVLQRENYDYDQKPEYVVNIKNMKPSYNQEEIVRFDIFAREKDWQPTIYTKSYNTIENITIPNLFYKIFILEDNYTVIDYSTGSLAYSKTSYDSNGNYFDLDMSLFERDYAYAIRLATYDGANLQELKEIFKFRVE